MSEESSEAPEAKSEEVKPEVKEVKPFVSKSQAVADDLEDSFFGVKDGDSSDTPEEKSDGDEEVKEVSEEQSDETNETTEEETEESPSLAEDEVKSKVEKRKDKIQDEIDKLVSQKKLLEEGNEKLLKNIADSKPGEKETTEKQSEKHEFTEPEIQLALKRFMEEGNSEGVNDIMNYKVEQLEKKLTQEYQNDKKQAVEVSTAKQKEWKNITLNFSPTGYDDEFLKKNPDFDINDQNSLLFQISKAYYEDGELGKTYAGDGGMRRAVQDAFNELLLKQVNNPTKPKKKTDSVKTVNIKQSLGSGASDGSGISDSPEAKYSSNEDLSDVINERKNYTKKRTTIGV